MLELLIKERKGICFKSGIYVAKTTKNRYSQKWLLSAITSKTLLFNCMNNASIYLAQIYFILLSK